VSRNVACGEKIREAETRKGTRKVWKGVDLTGTNVEQGFDVYICLVHAPDGKAGGTACRTKESSVERRNPANGSRISSEELCTQVILAVNGGNQTAKQI
jgi:hypothetical protein